MTSVTSFAAWCSETMSPGNCRWLTDHRIFLAAFAGSLLLLFGVAEGWLQLRERRRAARREKS